MLVDKSKDFALDLFFPKFCFGCQKEGTYLCQDCWHILGILDHNYCLCENHPNRVFLNTENNKCQKCRDKILNGLYFALPYKENHITQKLVKHLKYQPFVKDLAKIMAMILAEHFVISKTNTDQIWENSVLIPVPIHIKKQKARGYNQSEELACELSKITKVPVKTDVLIKIKHTDPQMELKRQDRVKNLENAFMANGLKPSKKIFLVDDVYTTGSTMSECARVLKKAGAKEIWGIAFAREEYLQA